MSNIFRYFIFLVLVNIGITYAKAYDFEIEGIYYNVDLTSMTASVTYQSLDLPSSYKGTITIPSEISYNFKTFDVVAIGDYAFKNSPDLITVFLPNSLTLLGEEAFSGCINLSDINIPPLISSIKRALFYNCQALEKIDLPNGITTIEDHAFEGCKNLRSIDLPSSLTSIGYDGFLGCVNLATIELPENLQEIGTECFYRCESLRSLNLPNNLTKIGNSAFKYSGLVSIAIPGNVIEIGGDCFAHCTSLKDFSLLESESNIVFNFSSATRKPPYYNVYYYENDLFKNCPLEFIRIGRPYSFKITSYDVGPLPFAEESIIENLQGLTINGYASNIQGGFASWDQYRNLSNIYSALIEPPTIGKFSNIQYMDVMVYVPEESTESYKNNEEWGKFWNIKGLQNTIDSPLLIELNIYSADLKLGETLQLEATVLPEDASDKTIIWNSSNENIASVSEEGLVTAISVGEATISATCEEVSAECVITVVEDAGVESLLGNSDSMISVYSVDGILIKNDCKTEDLKSLAKGIYIIVSGKVRYKITI